MIYAGDSQVNQVDTASSVISDVARGNNTDSSRTSAIVCATSISLSPVDHDDITPTRDSSAASSTHLHAGSLGNLFCR